MKNLKVIFTFAIIGTLCFITNAKAISDEDYAQLREMFSEARLSIMTEEEKESFLSENTTVEEKIYEVTETANGFTYSEVDSDLIDDILANFNSGISTMDASHQTTYKRIQIFDTELSNNGHRIMVYTQWLVTPATKSYDVTAMRIDGGYVVDGSQDGTQVYWKDGSYGHVTYSPNGTNIRKADNGFGISMNLVDGASYFETDISADVITTSSSAEAYGTYQHAITDVSLSQSQSYTISHNGLGDVLNFATSVHNLYDGMAGVSIAL